MGRRPQIIEPEKRARICRCYAENQSLEETGRAYRMSAETVRRIINEDRPEMLLKLGRKRTAKSEP